ncbi:MAG: hypothetical protein ACYCOU_15025 [Sulfobacillus sp.]
MPAGKPTAASQKTRKDATKAENKPQKTSKNVPAGSGRASGSVESLKAKVLIAFEQCFTPQRALRRVGVPRYRFEEWVATDGQFSAGVALAQQVFIEKMEGDLIDLGRCRGTKYDEYGKENFTALMAFLNAHHFAYGRIRAELLERMLIPFVDQVMQIVTEAVPTDTANALRAELYSAAFATGFGANGKRAKGAGAPPAIRE